MNEDGNGKPTLTEQSEEQRPNRRFGGLTPSEAGKRSAQARLARSRAGAVDTDPLSQTRKALEEKAAKGDVYAARELREYHDHYYGSASTGEAWTALLSPLQLGVVRHIIFDARQGLSSTWLECLPEDERHPPVAP